MMTWMGSSSKEPESHEEKNRVSSFRGYLLKLRRSPNLLAPQWGKRWFSIEGRYLNWYRNENDISPSGMINLKYIRSVYKVESPGCFTFAISCPDRNLVLRCSSMQEINNWIRAIHMHADIARGGNGTNIVSDFNEEPLRFHGMTTNKAKQSKNRTSLTLEEELDLNLKKLEALADEVKSSPRKDADGSRDPVNNNGSPDEYDEDTKMRHSNNIDNHTNNSSSNKRLFSKPYNNTRMNNVSSQPYDRNSNNPTDVLGRLRDFSGTSTTVSGGLGYNQRNRGNSGGGDTGYGDVVRADRVDSTTSIEDIPIANTRVVNRTNSGNRRAGQATSSDGNTNTKHAKFYPTTKPAIKAVTAPIRAQLIHNNLNTNSNNLDRNYAGYSSDDNDNNNNHYRGGNGRGAARARVSSNASGTSYASGNGNGGGGGGESSGGPRYVSRIADSEDDFDGVDEGTFTYVPEAVVPVTYELKHSYTRQNQQGQQQARHNYDMSTASAGNTGGGNTGGGGGGRYSPVDDGAPSGKYVPDSMSRTNSGRYTSSMGRGGSGVQVGDRRNNESQTTVKKSAWLG